MVYIDPRINPLTAHVGHVMTDETTEGHHTTLYRVVCDCGVIGEWVTSYGVVAFPVRNSSAVRLHTV